MRLSELSVRRPVFATVISLLLIIVGLVSLSRLAVREYPDIDPPIVSINTNYRGASAQVVENKITQVIEDRIAGIEGIEKLKSTSRDERSSITIEFAIDRDVAEAANDVRDRVSRILNSLPEEADPPEVSKAEVSADPILFINLSSDTLSPLQITDYAERYIADRLSAVPGVARVNYSGQRRYAMRVWIDRRALAARQLTVADVEAALRRENVQIPAGRLESTQRELSLRTDTGFDSAADFEQLVVGRGADGYLVRLGEVADVRLGAENERSVSRSVGIAGITVLIEPQSKANILEVVRGVRAEMDRLRPSLPRGMDMQVNLDQSQFVAASLHEVRIAIVFALLAVLVVIYLFLGDWRATLIPAVTIPISIIPAFAIMDAFGYSINVLTLLGIVLAVGLVVDDAIVVLENIFRRHELGQPPLLAAIDGSREIAFAVIATTLTLVAVFVPLSFLPGNIGRLFREFGFTVAAAILFSALVALTLTPMLASKIVGSGQHRNRLAVAIDRVFHRIGIVYTRQLRAIVVRPWRVVAAVAVLALVAGLAFRSLPAEFAPREDRGWLILSVDAPEGASLQYTDGQARQVEKILFEEMQRGDIRRFVIRIPGGFGGSSAEVNTVRGFVLLADWSERTRSAREIQQALLAKLGKLPGVRASIIVPQGFSGRGFAQPVQAVIGGPDYEQLAVWSRKIQQLAEQNPGLANVDTDYKERKPQLNVAVDRNRAADLGVSLENVGRTLETVLGSRIVTTYIDRGREYNVVLQGKTEERATPTDLSNLYVRSDRTGELIPLSNLVRLQESAGALALNRFDRLRSVTISSGLNGDYTMGEAVKWFQDTVARELPPTAKLSFDGESREFLKTGQQLYLTFLFALTIVFLVLAAQFESFRHPFVILTTVPLALLGAVLGLKLFHWFGVGSASINIFSQIAVVMLIGIAAKNGVLIVEFANQLRDRGEEFLEAIVQAAAIRLRPVLMTSLCTAFGALPFLFAYGAGSEQRLSIGIVVFFGTTISVFLTLGVVPAVYALVARRSSSPQHLADLIERLRASPVPAAVNPPIPKEKT